MVIISYSNPIIKIEPPKQLFVSLMYLFVYVIENDKCIYL